MILQVNILIFISLQMIKGSLGYKSTTVRGTTFLGKTKELPIMSPPEEARKRGEPNRLDSTTASFFSFLY